jgi:pyruvate formate-lyase activating enzyme-like uncharacterized protein
MTNDMRRGELSGEETAMRMLPIQDVLTRKFARQAAIPQLECHASGHCAHFGRISPGCLKCFIADNFSINIPLGPECNAKCVYCYGGLKDRTPSDGEIMAIKTRLLQKARKHGAQEGIIPTISFTGGGEPLLSIGLIERYMQYCKGVEKHLTRKPWYYVYTNGIIADEPMIRRLADLGFDEIRFHLGASDFARKVYRNLETAVKYIDTVSVETPAWPPHRKKLFAMLPILEETGVKHLNIGEIEIDPFNMKTIDAALPDAEVYQFYAIHLYDGGLVYDLMEEIVAQRYSFSVLDCSAFVKSMQRAPGKWLMHEPVPAICTL